MHSEGTHTALIILRIVEGHYLGLDMADSVMLFSDLLLVTGVASKPNTKHGARITDMQVQSSFKDARL